MTSFSSMAAIKVLVLTTMMVASTIASVYDCWDPEKLTRMNFPVSHQEANDPNLGKFSKLLKCVMQQQSKQPGGLSNMVSGMKCLCPKSYLHAYIFFSYLGLGSNPKCSQ